ncbi:hypothetical protein [Candidatus Electronema sp. JM]|uniref:hypothetical protein n=1 Tax=Candidatus Electronema sp. JM TaxID=3401571 RepID=UPI003AA83FF5
MPSPFTPDQLASLSAQIDQQLALLRDEPSNDILRGHVISTQGDPSPSISGKPDKQDIPDRLPAQWQIIAAVTKEEPRSFWQKFKQAARRDLCEEGGVLYAQWQRHRDLSSKSVLESFGAVLVAMGYSGNALQVLAVAAGVIVLHLGCTVICEQA